MRHKEESQRPDTTVLPAVRRALAKLGADIQIARRRRRIRQQSFADNIGVSRATLHRLEAGDPGVSIRVLCRACLALGHLEALRTLIEIPERDAALLADPPPKRIRRARFEPPVETPAPGDNASFDEGLF